ncbi:MAG TPA: hypothetical protein VEC12_08955, partial [Bacteroidia bacterium]|nr:hypothetical protein [Bacteroidia bacterium]
MNEFWNRNKVHIGIIALFLVVSVLYCHPVLSGKVMNQNDELTAKALNREAEEYYKKTGEFIGWSQTMFSGMPTSVGQNSLGNYSVNLIYFFAEVFNGFSFDVIFWCLVGIYVLFCALGITPWLGALGSFIFAFSTYNILSLEAGHAQKTFNIALVPVLLAGIYLIFQKRYIWGFILAAIGVNYQIGMGHYQITYYAAVAAFVMCIYYGIRWTIQKQYNPLGNAAVLLLLAAILGTLPNLTVLNVYYASFETTRGGASELTPKAANTDQADTEQGDGLDFNYATQWSYGLGETFTFLVPNAYGGADNLIVERNTGKPRKENATFQAMQQYMAQVPPQQQQQVQNDLLQAAKSYWGDQPFVGGPYYYGIIVCFLMVIGLVLSNRNEKWWVFAITLLFLFLSWGRDSIVYQLFFDLAPVFNKFRTPSMAQSVMVVGFSVLAIFGLMAIAKNENPEKTKKTLLYTGAGFGALLLIMALSPTMLFDFTSVMEEDAANGLPESFLSAMIEDRAELMKKDAWRSIAFLGLAFGLAWLYIRGSFKANALLVCTGLLIVLDLLLIDTRYLNKDNFVKRKDFRLRETPADMGVKQLAQQDGAMHYRVFNLTINPTQDAQTSQFHKSIGGYHGAKLRKYQELLENQINNMNPSVLSMLNTHYLIVGGAQGPTPQRSIKKPMGNAWFVNQMKVVENGDQEMAALNVDSANLFDPQQTLVVQQKNLLETGIEKGFKPTPDPSATISLTSYAPHKMKYQYTAATDQLAVFSEIFYKQKDGDGWDAFIDGQPAKVFRANWVLRAMKVPAGTHTIDFVYNADAAATRGNLSFIFMVLLFVLSGMMLYLGKKGKLKWLT